MRRPIPRLLRGLRSPSCPSSHSSRKVAGRQAGHLGVTRLADRHGERRCLPDSARVRGCWSGRRRHARRVRLRQLPCWLGRPPANGECVIFVCSASASSVLRCATPPNKGLKLTKPSVLELRSLTPVFDGLRRSAGRWQRAHRLAGHHDAQPARVAATLPSSAAEPLLASLVIVALLVLVARCIRAWQGGRSRPSTGRSCRPRIVGRSTETSGYSRTMAEGQRCCHQKPNYRGRPSQGIELRLASAIQTRILRVAIPARHPFCALLRWLASQGTFAMLG